MTSHGYQLTLVDAAGNDLLELMENDAAYRIDTLGQDATFGNPVPVTDVISSLMADGGLTTLKSFNNRTAVFTVTIKAPDAGVMASGEAELMAALDNVAALCWDAPWAESSYFDVVACWSEHTLDDLGEVRQNQRRFTLTFECLPFARSKDLVTVNWTASGVEVSTASTTGWTVVGGGAIEVASGHIQKTTTGSDLTLSRSVLMDEFVWLKVEGALGGGFIIASVSVNGVSIPDAKIRKEALSGHHFYTIPTHAWRGSTATIQFTIGAYGGGSNRAILEEFWTVPYPNATTAPSATVPRGIGAVDVVGTARAPIALISFTAPAGGAWLYTAPDPNTALRDRGAIENLYTRWTVSSGDPVYLPGDYARVTQRSQPQPRQLHPDGIWPQYATSEDQFAYPSDRGVAVSYFPAGSVSVISASPELPSGFHSTALVFEEHALYPGRCGFAVIAAATGLPITTTITYYPHWKHHAAQ